MVKLRLQASGLPKMDFLSKSDPMCVCFEKVSGSWKEVGRTETKKNTHNPAWDTTFKLKNTSQDLKFEVYDSDSKSTNLKKKDYMGALEVNLNLVVEKKRFSSNLKGANSTASLSVSAEIMKTIHMQISANSLKDMDAVSKSDPFFSFKSRDPYGYFSSVYTSEHIMDDLNPRWKPFSVLDADLCRGDYNAQLKLVVFDWDKGGSHDMIGSCDVTVNSLMTAYSRGAPLELVNPKKRSGRRGMINIESIKIE